VYKYKVKLLTNVSDESALQYALIFLVFVLGLRFKWHVINTYINRFVFSLSDHFDIWRSASSWLYRDLDLLSSMRLAIHFD
jgi:hypothetical protein